MFRAAIARNLRVPLSSYKLAPIRIANRVPQPIRFYAGVPSLTRDLAKERIIELLEGFDKVDTSKGITEESGFISDLGLDSLDVMEIVMEVEHEFNIQIPDHEADSLKTVGQTIDYILAQDDAV